MTDETRIERFHVPTLAQLEPLKSNTVGDAELCEIQGVLQRYHEGADEGDVAMSYEDAIQACDKILGTCGVEALSNEGDPTYTDEGIRMCPPFSYCNNGDSYAPTLARDHKAGAWVVAGWADLREEFERDEEIGDYEIFEACPDVCPCCHGKALSLEFFAGSARGPSYSWVCDSCNHHCYAATSEDGAVTIGEDFDCNTVQVCRAGERFGIRAEDGPPGYWGETYDTPQEAREAWTAQQDAE
jgi:hypothetical protein